MTKEDIETALQIDPSTALRIDDIFRGGVFTDIPGVLEFLKGCPDEPDEIWVKLVAINILLSGLGLGVILVEFDDCDAQEVVGWYVNRGDAELATIIYDSENEEFVLASPKDFFEDSFA